MVRFLIQMAAKGWKNARVGIFCETFPELKKRQIDRVEIEMPEWLGKLHKTDMTFTLAKQFGGGIIYFLNLDKPSKYKSVEFAAIGVDELTMNRKETFDLLRSRLRWTDPVAGPFKDVRFFGGTNPGEIGHLWVKKLWIDRDFEDENGLDPSDFCFVPSKAADNPHLSPDYLDTVLGSLPAEMQSALKDGSWDLFAGQFVKEWKPSVHVIDPIHLDPDWERGVAIDYGFRDPWCALYGAREPETGRIYVYRELYEREIPVKEQAQRILMAGAFEKRKFAVADPSMWNRQAADVASIAQTYINEGLTVVPANNDRVSGWTLMRASLGPMKDGRPGLYIFNTCDNLIRTIPGLTYHPHIPEDCNTRGEDHAPDTLRYLVAAFTAYNTPTAFGDTPRIKRRKPFAGRIRW